MNELTICPTVKVAIWETMLTGSPLPDHLARQDGMLWARYDEIRIESPPLHGMRTIIGFFHEGRPIWEPANFEMALLREDGRELDPLMACGYRRVRGEGAPPQKLTMPIRATFPIATEGWGKVTGYALYTRELLPVAGPLPGFDPGTLVYRGSFEHQQHLYVTTGQQVQITTTVTLY